MSQPLNRVPSSSRLREHFQRGREKLASLARQARVKVGGLAGKVKGWCVELARKAQAGLRLAEPYRRPLVIAAGVGMAAGAMAYFAGPLFAAGAGCLAGFVSTLGIQAAIAFRRLVGMTNLT